MILHVTNIKWDGADESVPTEVFIESSTLGDKEPEDYLSDTYGFCMYGFHMDQYDSMYDYWKEEVMDERLESLAAEDRQMLFLIWKDALIKENQYQE